MNNLTNVPPASQPEPTEYPRAWFAGKLGKAQVPSDRADILRELAELPDGVLAKALADAKAAYGPALDGLTD
jgi:hypothetical protein